MNPGTFEQILPGLHRWTSSLRGSHQPVRSHVWHRGSKAVLIDPAADLTPATLLTIGVHTVDEILVTHFQEEHVAGCFHFPGAKVYLSPGDEYLAAGRALYERSIENWLPPWDWTTRGNYRGHVAGAPNERPTESAVAPAASLAAGVTPAGFRVLSTPGHGKHAVTLIAEIDGKRIGFCGDLVCGQGNLWNWFDCDWDYGHQTGQQTVRKSAETLRRENLDLLCPAHGEVIREPTQALTQLIGRLDAVLGGTEPVSATPVNFPEKDSAARGFREVLPCLHQWRDGNCAVLVSKSGNALMVDDGLCYWQPLPEREAHHRTVIEHLKRALGIRRIEIVIPTHYHGDHTENIPALAAMEGSEIVCLDSISEPIEHPERFRLSAPLPWYGTRHGRFRIARKLSEGERLRWHEFDLEFFHLGGQTFYSLGVAVDIDGTRTLFVGDAIDFRKPLCEPVLTYNKADPATAGWAYATEQMLARRPDLLVCGHGSAIRNPIPLLERRRDAWQQRLQQFTELSARPDLREFFDPFL